MRVARAWGAGGVAFMAAALLSACTSGAGSNPPTAPTVTNVVTMTNTRTVAPSPRSVGPIPTGPTRAAAAPSCPWLDEQTAADRVGMRLARITVLRTGGRVVGCRFYALQNSPLHHSEHLPGPHQPAVEILTTRYPSSAAAHNAFILLAQKGLNHQQARLGKGGVGLCFQSVFYPPDHGRDWGCTVNLGSTLLVVRTVVVTPALNVIEVTRQVAAAVR